MENKNHICTLGYYSRPSHEGYRNTIKLPDGNNVVPLRSDTIWLLQNGCSFYRLRFEDPNQHLKDFLKLVDSLDLDLANKERTRLVQIFYDHVNSATQMAIDYAAGERLRKLRPEVAWEIIEDLAQYEEEKWIDPIFSEKGSPDYINATLEQELESMKCQVGSLMRSEMLLDYKENKLECEDEDKVEIKMMGTGMDKESLEHNLYENDITLIICHNFSLTSNPLIKPKDLGSFRMKVVEPLTIHTPPSPYVATFIEIVCITTITRT
ncbi:hypothetical protein Tco_0612351 [Tanacetum coccineum]